MSSLLARALFLPSLAYNVLMEKVSSREWYNTVDHNLILGALPLRWTTRELVEKEHVRAVVSLNEDFELRYLANSSEEWHALGVEYLHFNVIDMFEAPSQNMLSEGVDFIDRNITDNRIVYVHCKAGRSRSATLVSCYLMKKYNWTPEEAVSHLKAIRSHVILTEGKMEALKLFYQNSVLKNVS